MYFEWHRYPSAHKPTLHICASAGHEIRKAGTEKNVSQLFIAIDISKLDNHSLVAKTVNEIIEDYHQSIPADDSKKITFPGERVLQNRKKNLANGIPVLKKVWDQITALKN